MVSMFIVCLQILDCVLGHNEVLFRRAQLKALVSIHSREVSVCACAFSFGMRVFVNTMFVSGWQGR